jgi:hypothetical protein
MYTMLKVPAVTVHCGESVTIPITEIPREDLGYVRAFPMPDGVPQLVGYNAFIECDHGDDSSVAFTLKLRFTNPSRVEDVVMPATIWAFAIDLLLELPGEDQKPVDTVEEKEPQVEPPPSEFEQTVGGVGTVLADSIKEIETLHEGEDKVNE